MNLSLSSLNYRGRVYQSGNAPSLVEQLRALEVKRNAFKKAIKDRIEQEKWEREWDRDHNPGRWGVQIVGGYRG